MAALIDLPETERGITFHRVPAGNETLKKEWLVKIKCNLPKLSCCFVCSNHFEPNCFQVNYRHEFLGGSSRRGRLKETAVPTIFCHKKTKEKRQTSEMRRQKAERHEFFAYCFQWRTKIIKSLQCSLSFTSSYSTQKNSLNCFVRTNLHNCNTGTIQHSKRDFPVLNHFLTLTPVTHPHEAAHKHMALFTSQPRLQVSHIRHYRK